MLLSQNEVTLEQINLWKAARLLNLDEISLAGKDIIMKLDQRHWDVRENQLSTYGGMKIVFAGDFSQPVKGEPLYSCLDFIQWHEWVNSFIELHGNHRFAKEPSCDMSMLVGPPSGHPVNRSQSVGRLLLKADVLRILFCSIGTQQSSWSH